MIVVSLHINYVIFLLQQSIFLGLEIVENSRHDLILLGDKSRIDILLIVFIYKIMSEAIVKQTMSTIEQQILQNWKQNYQVKVERDRSKPRNENLHLNLLKQTFQNTAHERLKNRMQREIQSKEDKFIDLNLKYMRSQKQLAKINANNKYLTNENKQLKVKIQELVKELNSCQAKQKQLHSQIIRMSNNQQLCNKCLTKIQQQNVQLRQDIQNLRKQQKITLRRIGTVAEEKIKNLQGKLQIKTKQQAKIQELLQHKKEQQQKIIMDKDNEISELTTLINNLNSQINKLTQNLASAQTSISQQKQKTQKIQIQYDEQLIKCNQKQKQLQNSLDQIERYKKMMKKIQQLYGIIGKLDEFSQNKGDVLKHIDYLREWIKEKIKQDNDQRNKLISQQSQIQILKKAELSIKNKISILEQQLTFFKSNRHQNTQFVNSIKQHLTLQSKQNTISNKQAVHGLVKTLSKQIKQTNQIKEPSHLDWKSITKTNVLSKTQMLLSRIPSSQNTNLPQKQNQMQKNSSQKPITQNHKIKEERTFQPTNSLFPLQKDSKYNQKLSFKPNDPIINKDQYLSAGLIVAKKGLNPSHKQNQVIKEQIDNKKKQLMYVMYRQQKIPGINLNDRKDAGKIERIESVRKRSSSMSDLVRLRCQQQLP